MARQGLPYTEPFPLGRMPITRPCKRMLRMEPLRQVAVRISQNDPGGADDDHGTTIVPNIGGFYQAPGMWRVFPGHALNANPVGFTVTFGATDLTITADSAIPSTDVVAVRVAVWA